MCFQFKINIKVTHSQTLVYKDSPGAERVNLKVIVDHRMINSNLRHSDVYLIDYFLSTTPPIFPVVIPIILLGYSNASTPCSCRRWNDMNIKKRHTNTKTNR